MALEGNIRDFSLADIFQLIGIQRKTGILTLRHEDEEVKVSFANGLVVNADSKAKRLDDRVGTVLVKTGKLGEEDLKRALKIQRDTLKKVGVVLVEEQMVRPEDLREALGIQITQTIYRLFRWKAGHYHFEQDVQIDYDHDNFRPMSAESILMEGMRMIDEWPIIERKISSFDMVFERVALEGGAEPVVVDDAEELDRESKDDDFDMIFGGEKSEAPTEEASASIKLTRDENTVYQQVDGEQTVQDIIDRTMLSEFEICRALYDLTNRNLIAPMARERSGPDVQVARRVEVGPWVARVLYGVMLAALAGSALLMRSNPLNLLTPPPFGGEVARGLQREAAAVRLHRVARALEVLRLAEPGGQPTLEKLVEMGFLGAPELMDPWGGRIELQHSGGRILVSTRTGPEPDAPRLTLER